jgi:3-hydroxymyristoyl/3-hydroxydecanoyl-(acyl carrier protein) dehydratase
VGVAATTLRADHPAAQGHFPGNPVIPGAVLLAEALRLIEGRLGRSLAPHRVRRAKFPGPARPGEELRVEFAEARGSIRFECAVGARAVLVGEIECSASSAR